MSSYSIDEPRYSIDVEEGEDLVVGRDQVTERDRDLLRADEEVLEALNQKSSSRGIRGIRGFKKSTNSKNGTGRKVKFGSEYQQIPSSGIYDKPTSSQGNSSINKGRRFENMNYADNDEDDSDGNSEIEIDLETQPGRRRRRNHNSIRKIHIFLFLVIVLATMLFFSNILSPPPSDSQKTPQQPHRPISKIKKQQLSNGTHDFYPTTLVVSLDGFHPHYISEELTPNLHRLLTSQYGVPYMIPSFPSSTFPNHWTMVTGLYPANHGIVGNTFFDPLLGKQFFNTKPAQSLDPVWWGGEPIWQTASFQGVVPAVHMWPGSEVVWKMETSFEVDKYNGSELLSSKRDTVLSWFDRGELNVRPELMLTYVPNVDTIGHQYGIAGSELESTISNVDEFVGGLLNGISERNLTDIANVIIVSDHGMAPTSNNRLVFMEDFIDMDKIDYVDGSPLVGIRPKNPAELESLYKQLKSYEPSNKSWSVYLKEDMPKQWNFGGINSDYKHRIADLWIIPSVGWSITTREQLKKMNNDYQPHGVHGYNNSEVLMRAIFLATGPYFGNQHALYEPIPNVDVYNIICDTLNLKPTRNDGLSAERSLVPLASGWADSAEYPGVMFRTEVLPINSTYDELFRSKVVDNGIETSARPIFSFPSTAASMPTEIPSTGEADNVDDTDDIENDDDSGDSNDDDSSDLASKISDLFDEFKDGVTSGYEGFKSWLGGILHGNKDDDRNDQ